MKRLKNYLRRMKHSLVEMRNRFYSPEIIFTNIYSNKGWGNEESVSGIGSTLEQTKNVVELLPFILEKHEIKTILDIPCGDFNWMKTVDLSGVSYRGGDIVKDLVAENIRKYQRNNISFFCINLLEDVLPTVDLIFCRDCLVHFSDRKVWQSLYNIRKSGSKYLLTTTFPGRKENPSIVTGSWRPLNLQVHPFNFPEPIEIYFEGTNEVNGAYGDKALGLWEIKNLPTHDD